MLRRNVLILHTGALGDFVLAWPLVIALSRMHPQSRIIVVTHASKGALAEAALRVEWADVEQGWHGLFTAGVAVGERAAKLVEGAHAIYTFIGGGERLKQLAPEAQIVELAPASNNQIGRHASEQLLNQLTHPGTKSAVEQILRSIKLRGIGTGRSHDGDVVVHPGSGSPDKCWPLEKFVKLIERIKRMKKDVRVLLGEVETERWSADEVTSLEKVAPVRRTGTYVELLNELRTASLMVGNDSGPGHLSGIIGVPTLVLFGPTDPVMWRPLGPHIATIRREPLTSLGVDEVVAGVKDLLKG